MASPHGVKSVPTIRASRYEAWLKIMMARTCLAFSTLCAPFSLGHMKKPSSSSTLPQNCSTGSISTALHLQDRYYSVVKACNVVYWVF